MDRGSTGIGGATRSTYSVASAATSNTESYSVFVSNPAGSVTSNADAVPVNTPATSTTRTPTPRPTPAPSSDGSGGGGGAPRYWFFGALLVLVAVRQVYLRRLQRGGNERQLGKAMATRGALPAPLSVSDQAGSASPLRPLPLIDSNSETAKLRVVKRKTAMNILALPSQPPLLQIQAIEDGLPATTLASLSDMFGIPKKRIISALRFAERTILHREAARARFTPEESERLLRLLRLRHILRDAFSTDKAVGEWIETPASSLEGKTPLEMLATDVGSAKISNLALAMVHGVPI